MAGISSGALFRLTLAGEKVVHATSSNLSISLSTTETASKDIGGGNWTQVTPDKLSFSGSCELLHSYDDTIDSEARIDVEGLFDAITARVGVAAVWTNSITGDVEYSGTVFLTSLEQSFADGENATASFQITGSGALSKATIS
jgi:acetylornithine deacetylase/succinyl-diaminopimelate desuccinylase-like protein